jgi:hypothetical protein
MHSLVKGVCFLSAVVTLSGCSVKMNGGGGSPAKPQEVQELQELQGPDISGTWESGCEVDDSGSKQLVVTYVNKKIARRSLMFSDRYCSSLKYDIVESGSWRYAEAHKDGSFTVEYVVATGNNQPAFAREKVLLDGDTLFVSDYVVGDIPKAAMIAMKRKQ